jgi:RimJ/RimL family protein N-acetyltransferase
MEVTRSNYRRHGYGMFAIERRGDRAPVGFGGLVHPGDGPDAEAKYACIADACSRGHATEFVRGPIGHAAAAYGLTRIVATVAAGNAASRQVLLKFGFRRSGTRAEAIGGRTELFELHR